MKRFFVATVGTDYETTLQNPALGLELDQFCMSENLDGDNRERYCQEISDLLSRHNLTAEDLVLHAPFTELYPAAIDPKALQLMKDRMADAYEICQRFGIQKMVVHSGYLPFIYFKSWHNEKCAKFWTEFMADKPSDFQVCIENVLEDEPYMMRDMMELIRQEGPWENIGLCLDVGHAHCMSKVDILTWIDTLAPYISHFHLHNNDGTGDTHSAFAEGALDMDEIIRHAREHCRDSVTFTSEVMNAPATATWLAEHGYI